MATAIFRTDASRTIGTGHAMRCLTLADALKQAGTTCRFVCRELDGHLIETIRARGHAVMTLPAPAGQVAHFDPHSPHHAAWLGVPWEQDAADSTAALQGERPDWLVVDHYALDARWERRLRPHCVRLFAIDDLADRPHECDVLLDQNLGRKAADYAGKVPGSCDILAGAAFALLRPAFPAARAASLERRKSGNLGQLLIALGGVDKDNITSEILAALQHAPLPEGCRIVVAMGAKAPWTAQVREAAERLPFDTQVQVGTDAMAELMAASDLAIGAAGTMAWERCCLGLPTLTVVIAENQRAGAQALAASGACMLLPLPLRTETLTNTLNEVLAPGLLRSMQEAAAAITDGTGVQRVLGRMT